MGCIALAPFHRPLTSSPAIHVQPPELHPPSCTIRGLAITLSFSFFLFFSFFFSRKAHGVSLDSPRVFRLTVFPGLDAFLILRFLRSR